MKKQLLDVDVRGLARTYRRRGGGVGGTKARMLFELISNALDQNTEFVKVTIEPVPNKALAKIVVEDDDPDGFKDLAHAYTLFGMSPKSHNPEKRGRFDIGEKLVISQCEWAEIESTTGAIEFNIKENTREEHPRRKRSRGTIFTAHVKMTREEIADAEAAVKLMIVSDDVNVFFNGKPLEDRKPLKMFHAKLATEFTDADGEFHRSIRNTIVEVYEPLAGEKPSLYEMGVPVVETGDRWHVNVGQRVLLNVERDNVTPAYLRDIRTLVANEMADKLDSDSVNAPWIAQALEDEKVAPETVKRVLEEKYGKPIEKIVMNNPSDPESRAKAISEGYAVIEGRAFSKNQHANIKRLTLSSTADVAPVGRLEFSADGVDKWHPRDKWTNAQERIVEFAHEFAHRLLGKSIEVDILNDITAACGAAYGQGHLTLNLGRLGKAWFEDAEIAEVVRLLVHEFAHDIESNHLSSQYHGALSRFAGQSTKIALEDPQFFQRFFPAK